MPRMHLYEAIEGNMKKKVYMICVIALLVGLSATTALATSDEEECDSNLNIEGMEQKIFVDKPATQRESFGDKAARPETKIIQLERDLEHATSASDKRIDDLRSHLNERIDDSTSYMETIFLIYSGGFALVLALLGFLGWKTVKEMAEERIKKLITDDFVKEIIEEKGQPAIDKIVCSLEERGKSSMDGVVERVEKYGLEKLTDEDKKEVSESAESTSKSKDESSYTYDDWFVKGIDEYDKKMYKEAAESFVNAAKLEANEFVFFNAAVCYAKVENHDLQEKYFLKAIEADPKHSISFGSYALFLENIRKDYNEAEKYYKKAIEAYPNYADCLGNYAIFLSIIRKNPNKAEKYYKRAIEANPKHANNLGNYATFLQSIRKDYDNAEKYYRRAIAINPKHEASLGNYTGLLFVRGEKDEGFKRLEEAMSLAVGKELIQDLWFYSYAHKEGEADRINALKEIKKLIVEGERSEGFDMTANVERAIADGHPSPELLKDLEQVICVKKDAKELEKYEEWKQA